MEPTTTHSPEVEAFCRFLGDAPEDRLRRPGSALVAHLGSLRKVQAHGHGGQPIADLIALVEDELNARERTARAVQRGALINIDPFALGAV